MMGSAAETAERASWWASSGLTIILAALYPTVFVVSQNWYALSVWQSLFLVAAAAVAGVVVFAVVEGAFRVAGWRPAASGATREVPARAIALGLVCAGLIYFLLIATLRATVPSTIALVVIFFVLAAAFGWAFRQGVQRYVNFFLAALVAVASLTWVLGAAGAPPQILAGIKPDFERAVLGSKPNIYLFIYDAYGSEDVYRKVFKTDNSKHYKDLEERGFKVVHTFSNYGSTWQTTIGTFLGQHHFYETATGNADSQSGRPIMAGLIHNPVLHTLMKNGYRFQYVHGIDYFVNEPGMIEFVYPESTALSALRAFGNPTLDKIGGRKRRVTLDKQTAVLYDRIHPQAGDKRSPWFTFAHVNLPAHSPSEHWTRLAGFEQTFRDRTVKANEHMLKTIDRIKAADPKAVIAIFGDHGAARYNELWDRISQDAEESFRQAGVSTEIVALDTFGIMIAIHFGGHCDDRTYRGMTPVNIMRVVFSCLSGDRGLLSGKAADVTLAGGKGRPLLLIAKDGVALPKWELFQR